MREDLTTFSPIRLSLLEEHVLDVGVAPASSASTDADSGRRDPRRPRSSNRVQPCEPGSEQKADTIPSNFFSRRHPVNSQREHVFLMELFSFSGSSATLPNSVGTCGTCGLQCGWQIKLLFISTPRRLLHFDSWWLPGTQNFRTL